MRDQEAGWIRLSALEFVHLWATHVTADLPPVLGLPQVGRTAQARFELTEWVSSSLAERDLGSTARPAPDLAARLRALADGELSVDLRVHGSGTPLFGYATSGRSGVAVVARVGEEVRLGSVGQTALVGSLLGALAPLPAGPGRPANLGAADYAQACAEGDRDGMSGFLGVLRRAGMRPPEASTLAQAIATRHGGGQLGATLVSRGRQVRAPSTVNWVDTPDGRYALRRSGSWITLTPADTARLQAMAEELLADLR